jgi:hypothetical protein
VDAIAAKQFLISKVLQEAELSNVQLSETERKMLYFTEAQPSLPDILEVNADFERAYDADEYEDKIADLLKKARKRDIQISPSSAQKWEKAIDALRKQDHYILVMVAQAFGAGSRVGKGGRLTDFLVYIAVAIGLVALAFLVSVSKSTH